MKALFSKVIACMAVAAILYSFSPKPGGEGFEIYLGSTLLTQQFGNKISNTKNLQLPGNAASGELVIKYWHCGQVGKSRTITLKDANDHLLREFHYADVSATKPGMSLKVKEIINVKKGDDVVRIYYSSKELPNGRMLAAIDL